MSDPSRLARFVGSARRLLLFQLLASAGAVALTAWAVAEVQGVIEENERLEARVAELQAAREAVVAPVEAILPEVSETARESAPQPATAPGAPVEAKDGREADDVTRDATDQGVAPSLPGEAGNEADVQAAEPPRGDRGPIGATVTDRQIEARPEPRPPRGEN